MAQKNLSGIQPDQKSVLLAFLQQAVKPPTGINFLVATRQGLQTLIGGIISDVHVCGAWIGFTHDGVVYRTDEIADRNNFQRWYTAPKQAPFSEHKDFEGVFGPPNVTFLRMGKAAVQAHDQLETVAA